MTTATQSGGGPPSGAAPRQSGHPDSLPSRHSHPPRPHPTTSHRSWRPALRGSRLVASKRRPELAAHFRARSSRASFSPTANALTSGSSTARPRERHAAMARRDVAGAREPADAGDVHRHRRKPDYSGARPRSANRLVGRASGCRQRPRLVAPRFVLQLPLCAYYGDSLRAPRRRRGVTNGPTVGREVRSRHTTSPPARRGLNDLGPARWESLDERVASDPSKKRGAVLRLSAVLAPRSSTGTVSWYSLDRTVVTNPGKRPRAAVSRVRHA